MEAQAFGRDMEIISQYLSPEFFKWQETVYS